MNSQNKKMQITLEEISELLALKKWSRQQLAKEMGITRNAVERWFMTGTGSRGVSGPGQRLLLIWLAEAREASQSVPA